MRLLSILALCGLPLALWAEMRTLTLRQALEIAFRQNPDLALARLDETRALAAVEEARDPFSPRVAAGSGLAYSYGFPLSIEGSAPSLVRAQAGMSLFNRPQSYLVAKARQEARGAAIATQAKREEVIYRTAWLFLDAAQAAQSLDIAARQVENLERIRQSVRDRVAAGRELPVEAKRAELNLARARQRHRSLTALQDSAEAALALLLGMEPGDRVRPAGGEGTVQLPLPSSEEQAVTEALESNQELRQLQSALMARGLELRAARSAWMPKVDLIGQYGLFARFNNYDDFFRRFQRHNGLIGLAFQIPLMPGSASRAQASRAEAEGARLRLELNAKRSRLAVDVRERFQQVQQAESAYEVARLDLEVARDDVGVLLARADEGRAAVEALEQARFVENEKWMAFHEARGSLERARLQLWRETGALAALR